MSATNPTTCEHQWEDTGITFMASGRKWQQGKVVSYCPSCRKWGTRTTMFLDGDMFKTEALARAADTQERQRARDEGAAWLAEHYPDHVAAVQP